MTDKLDLSVPKHRYGKPAAFPKSMIIINLIILAVACAILAVMLFKPVQVAPAGKGASLPAGTQKDLALKLEKQGLNRVAAAAWEKYLTETPVTDKQAAKVWFRIGKLYQDAHEYDRALAAYYRSEKFKKLPELESDIGRRVQECLESAGRFAALRDELSARVGIKSPASGSHTSSARETVVAEIGPEKITRSDLDHLIEKAIDQQLSRMASYLPGDARNRQKEELLKQFSSADQRMGFLNQYLAREILYREARSQNLADDPGIQSEIKDKEKALLAERMIEKAYAENIKIQPEDLQAYYDAHKEAYQDTEKKTTRPFEDVKGQVYAALRADKEKAVREALLEHLKEQYDVVIHTAVSLQEKKAEKSSPSPKKTGTQKSK